MSAGFAGPGNAAAQALLHPEMAFGPINVVRCLQLNKLLFVQLVVLHFPFVGDVFAFVGSDWATYFAYVVLDSSEPAA